MSGRRVAVLQHVSFEGPGAIASWAEARGHALTRVRLYCGDPLPDASSVDALVVMGGPMSVAEESRFPFLREEKRLLRACVGSGRPVLGVCLGAQLLADALGSTVSAQGYREIGWFPLRWDARARTVPPLAHVPDSSVVFHWHGDTFTLPPATVPLGSSEACQNQGFSSAAGRTIGLQFHLEMRDEDVRIIVTHGTHELSAGGMFVQNEEAILTGSRRHTAPLRRLLDALLDGWLASAPPD